MGHQLLHDVPVPNLGADEIDPLLVQGLLDAKIGHQRADNRAA